MPSGSGNRNEPVQRADWGKYATAGRCRRTEGRQKTGSGTLKRTCVHSDEYREERPLAGWTWRGWCLVPLLGVAIVLCINRVDLLTPLVPLLHRLLGWTGLRLVLNSLSYQRYGIGEAEFNIIDWSYLLVFAWLRPRRTTWWIWVVVVIWTLLAQRIRQEFDGTLEILPGVEVFTKHLTFLGTAVVLWVFWWAWRPLWPLLFIGAVSVAVWHGVNIYGIAIPWNVPEVIEVLAFHASIVWVCVRALSRERATARLRGTDLCACCGYNLCGLGAPGENVRCPECGSIRAMRIAPAIVAV